MSLQWINDGQTLVTDWENREAYIQCRRNGSYDLTIYDEYGGKIYCRKNIIHLHTAKIIAQTFADKGDIRWAN